MRKYALMLAAMTASLVVVSTATAMQDKEWICHGTGSESNPFVLINVPTNSAHFTKHLLDGSDKLPVKVEEGLSCGGEDSPPTPPFNGRISFTVVKAECKPGEQGVPGFIVVQEDFKHGDYTLLEDGSDTGEVVIFEYPATCITTGAGPAGPVGLAGGPGTAGPAGPAGATPAVPAAKGCTSQRVYRFLVRKRYLGHLLTNVRVSDPGAKTIKVSKTRRGTNGRYVVVADYRGRQVSGFNSQRHILVTAQVGKRRLRFNENVDLCRPANGAQNAPSASGLASGALGT